MSRTIYTMGGLPAALSPGDVVTADFNEFEKAMLGDWTLMVKLARAGECPMTALIELLQGDNVIASTIVSPGETASDYPLELSSGQIASITQGPCTTTGLKVRVTADGAGCSRSWVVT